jgi:hypothetical protein
MTESVIAIGAVCAALATVWGLIDRISRPMKEMSRKLDGFMEWQKNQQADIDASKVEREILCRGFRAVCLWAMGQGANGEIGRALEDISAFLSRQAHEGRSYLRR